MPDIIQFATPNCLFKASKGLVLGHLKYGFPPFAPFAGTYTVGVGWSQTSYTAGQYIKRIQNGVVTGVYEAKSSFTASADPSGDPTRWRPHGITASGTGNDFWYGCEPITKWTLKAWYHVGIGWKLPIGLGFPRSYLGAICRYGGAKRRMVQHTGLNYPVTDNTQWEDYAGPLDGDFDYAFGRYAVLKFAPGDIVARISTGTPVFYRCKAAADYTLESDGVGDPASDSTRWEPYAGARSLFLDFAQPPLAFAFPFVHYTPTRRFATYRETTTIKVNDSTVATYERRFHRDPITGAVVPIIDESIPLVSLVSVPMPDPEQVTNPPRPEMPALPNDTPVEPYTYQNVFDLLGTDFNEAYNLKLFSHITVKTPLWPNLPTFTRPSYSVSVTHSECDTGRILFPPANPYQCQDVDRKRENGTYSDPWSLGGPYNVSMLWQGFGELDIDQGDNIADAAFSCHDITVAETEACWEWVASVPWYKHFIMTRRYVAMWYGRGYGEARKWYDWYGLTTENSTQIDATVKVLQRIELLNEIDDADTVAALVAVLGSVSLPSDYTAHHIELDIHGSVCRSAANGFAVGADYAYFRNKPGGYFQYITNWTDPRLVENELMCNKAVFWVEPAHRTVTQEVGGSPVETAFSYACPPTSHVFSPWGDLLATFRVSLDT